MTHQLEARILLGLSCLAAVAVGGCASGSAIQRRRATPSAAVATTLVLSDSVAHLDRPAREPMVVQHPNGTVFVSGYGGGATPLWKSRDRGATWTRVDVGSSAIAALGNSDVDLAVARDGTLYFITMTFDGDAGEGRGIQIGSSINAGATWTWTQLSRTRFDDRPWVDVAPDGTAHAIWNDGKGVRHMVSEDRGQTWTERPRVYDRGGSSHLAVGPNGEVAVRLTPKSASGNRFNAGVDLLAVSTDAGATWHTHPSPGQREWVPDIDTTVTPPRWVEAPLPRWVEPVAWDAQGNLYSLWTNERGLWLARSRDQGATWTSWHVASSRDVMYFPYLVAGGQGELAATWFSGHGQAIAAHVARFTLSNSDEQPRMVEFPAFHIDSWELTDQPGEVPDRDSGGEYLALAFLRDGGIAMVSPIQNQRAWHFGFTWWLFEAR